MLRRSRECANGHRFTTYEIHAAVKGSAVQRARVFAATARRRVLLWKRDSAVRADARPWQQVAAAFKISKSLVFAIRKRK